jgi:murein DD-endopeptidase MepM/ murein hydrolase activator NlpD
MSLGKIGIHILSGYTGNLGKPRIVKLVDPSPEYIRQVRTLVGDACTMVIRWTEAVQPLSTPVQNARDWFARRRPSMVDARALYEGYNEVADEQAAPFAAFEVERLRLMHGDGLRSAVGSWSVGVPDIPVWATYAPVLAAIRDGDAVSLHEYWIDAPDVGNQWHVGRWRLVPQLDNIKIVVTECGRDFVEGRGYSGWKLDKSLSANSYLAELRGYGAILDRFSNVLGATVFTAGQIIDPQWQPFEVNSIAAIITAESTQPVATPTPPAIVTPPMLRHPLVWSRVSQRFGENPAYYAQFGQRGHNGVDLAVPGSSDVFSWHGTPVVAAHDGEALIVRDDASYGLYVYIWGTRCDTLYAHLAEATIPSSKRVKAGDLIGWVGYTGNTLPRGIHGTHLHFGYRPKPYQMQNGYRGYEDPLPHLG